MPVARLRKHCVILKGKNVQTKEVIMPVIRSQNGWLDNGEQLKSTWGPRCPNCGSPKYVQTLSREYCESCGLECNYWGKGPNDVYKAMLDGRQSTEVSEPLD
jgi:hypothetical protein